MCRVIKIKKQYVSGKTGVAIMHGCKLIMGEKGDKDTQPNQKNICLNYYNTPQTKKNFCVCCQIENVDFQVFFNICSALSSLGHRSFNSIFDQINASLVSIRDFIKMFKNHNFLLTTFEKYVVSFISITMPGTFFKYKSLSSYGNLRFLYLGKSEQFLMLLRGFLSIFLWKHIRGMPAKVSIFLYLMCDCLGETIEMEELFYFLYKRFSDGAAIDSSLISTPSSASTHLYMIIR